MKQIYGVDQLNIQMNYIPFLQNLGDFVPCGRRQFIYKIAFCQINTQENDFAQRLMKIMSLTKSFHMNI